jgi:hypothetical protein
VNRPMDGPDGEGPKKSDPLLSLDSEFGGLDLHDFRPVAFASLPALYQKGFSEITEVRAILRTNCSTNVTSLLLYPVYTQPPSPSTSHYAVTPVYQRTPPTILIDLILVLIIPKSHFTLDSLGGI